MSAKNIYAVTADLIESYGNTVKNVIDALRAGGQQTVVMLDQRWSRTLLAPNTPIPAQMTQTLSATQQTLNLCITQSLDQSSKGAHEMVSQLVNLATQGVDRLAANASSFDEKTGLPGLRLLSQVSLPAASLMVTLASHIEQKSANMASKYAHDDVSTTTIKRTTAFGRKSRTKSA